MNEKSLQLAEKIAKAVISVGAFTADKKHQKGYGYISADAVLDRGGIALAENGVSVIPSLVSVEMKVTARSGQDKSDQIDAYVTLSMLVTDGEKEYIAPWYGCGTDWGTPDKAIYKAITSGHKYFLMKLLCISVGNSDSEHEEKSTSSEQRKPAQSKQVTPASGNAPAGLISPQMLVENGISADIPSAAETINKLGVGGKPAAEFWGGVVLYRAWRDAKKDPSAAAVAAIAGEMLPAQDDPTYSSAMPDPRTGDGENQ